MTSKPGKPRRSRHPAKPSPLQPPNDDLLERGGTMRDLRTAITIMDQIHGGPPLFDLQRSDGVARGAREPWLNADQLERCCDQDEALQEALQRAVAADCGPRVTDRVLREVLRVFEERYLVDVIQRFDAAAPMVVEYLLAKTASPPV